MNLVGLIILASIIIITHSILKKKRILFNIWLLVLVFIIFYMRSANDLAILKVVNDTIYFKDGTYSKFAKKGFPLHYTMFSENGEEIDKGVFISGKFQSSFEKKATINLEKQGLAKYTTYAHEYIYREVFIILVLLVIVYGFLFFNKDYTKIRDFIANGSKVPVTYLKQSEKEKIIGENIICKKCDTKMTIDKEIYSKGMHMLHLECLKCKEEIKMRID